MARDEIGRGDVVLQFKPLVPTKVINIRVIVEGQTVDDVVHNGQMEDETTVNYI